MPRIICFILFLIGIGCTFPQEAPSIHQKVSSSIAPNASKKDTVRPSPINYYTSTARRAEQIDKAYPYDIDLRKPDGTVVNSAQVIPDNGKPTVLLFWMTTCYPCRMELDAIQKKYTSWTEKEDFNLVAISMDFERKFPQFTKMVNEKNWPWPAYHDKNREFRLTMPGGLNGLPQTFVLDKNGEVVYHSRKYRTGDEDKLFAAVAKVASR